MVKLGAMNSSVCPSAGARSTSSAPITVLPPGRFSMTTLWPSALDRGGAMVRATVSVVPAAGNGTTSRTVFDGNSCAASGAASAPATTSIQAHGWKYLMIPAPLSEWWTCVALIMKRTSGNGSVTDAMQRFQDRHRCLLGGRVGRVDGSRRGAEIPGEAGA